MISGRTVLNNLSRRRPTRQDTKIGPRASPNRITQNLAQNHLSDCYVIRYLSARDGSLQVR